jgi:AraC-like DNA-binding protein
MSRPAFAARLTPAFGLAPHGSLTESRRRHAGHFPGATELPVKTIAGKIGYRSHSDSRRAVKARHVLDPVAYRRGPRGVARS